MEVFERYAPRPKWPAFEEMNSLQVRIVILNYKGQTLLPKCLPSIVEAAEASPYPTHVTVLDNLSPAESGLDYVAAKFPQVTIAKASKNHFLCSYNEYLKTVTEPVAILLNNDIKVDKNFVGPLVRHFLEEPLCFMASPRCMTWEGNRFEAGRSKAGAKLGFFWCSNQYPGYEKDERVAAPTAASGFGAFSVAKFLELGGYDELFLPGIMEDVDLCYRAAAKGYQLRYEPESVVHHMGQASFKKEFGIQGIQVLAWRNNFLFVWKNMKGLGFWFSHFFFVPLRILAALLRGNTVILKGFLNALKMRKRICETHTN